MTIELTAIVVRHERRVRLVFSSPLAGSAFGSPAPVAYVITNVATAQAVAVSAAILVTSATDTVELALGADLVQGSLYRVTTLGIVGADATSCTSASDQKFRFGEDPRQIDVEPKVLDADLILFGRDLVHTGTDYLETAEGDLASVGGVANAQAAHRRRMLGSPLPWAPEYSARARQYVDAPISSVGGLRGALQRQSLRDDRIQSVTVTFTVDEDDADNSSFTVTPTFIGGRVPSTDSVDVPI